MFATLADLKTHLNIEPSETGDDLELQFMLNAATEVVASVAGAFSGTAVDSTFAVNGGTVFLDRVPTEPITVTDSEGSPVTGFSVRAEARMLKGITATGYVSVSHSVVTGFVPYSVQLATLIIAGHLWETQRGTSPSQLALQQPDGTLDTFTPGRGYAIPDRARELLAPYTTSAGQVA